MGESELEIRHVGDTELHAHFARESEAQPCYVELSLEFGVLSARYSSEVSPNAVPRAVLLGFDHQWSIPPLTGRAANALLREVAPLAQRMLDDWTTGLNATENVIAVLGEDAAAADSEIAALIAGRYPEDAPDDQNADIVQEWSLEAATNGDEVSEHGITAETTDERLAEIEASILENLSGCMGLDHPTAVCPGLDTYLERLREELVTEAREEVEAELEAIAEAVASRPETVQRAARLGLSDRRIAELLGVSHVTVGTIRKSQ
ncbi:hypothetical protein ACIBEA_41880 [Streptomyces sp. NPDC051555]|uniref:hypothetical protein n=1 Tax=Streptomyces sp. NPDC051555 TaxID=3365657 RepID=UPI0037AB6F63